MEEQLRRSAATWRLVAAAVLVLWVGGSGASAVLLFMAGFGVWGIIQALAGVLVLLLLVGLVDLTGRVADGVADLAAEVRSYRESSSAPAAPLPAEIDAGGLRVAASGAYLREAPEGDALDWLAPGAAVVEEERQGEWVRVTAGEVTGWVEAARLR